MSRISRENAAMLMVDHQVGLLSFVRDFSPSEFKNNVLAMADIAALYKLPTVLTTSFEKGPNGIIMPEIKERLPKAAFIPRPGQINAWDNEDFVKAVKATGRKQLIIAGILTEVCVAFPTVSALAEGFEVFVVTDASGTFNETTRNAAISRMTQAGAVMISWVALASELQRDWRDNGAGLAKLFLDHLPEYSAISAAYNSVQQK